MLTDRERINEMHRRAEMLRLEKRNRIARISAISAAAASVAVIIAVGTVMPGLEEVFVSSSGSMRASIFSNNGALGYIIIGIIAFILGIAVTAFCYRLKKWQDEEKNIKHGGSND